MAESAVEARSFSQALEFVIDVVIRKYTAARGDSNAENNRAQAQIGLPSPCAPCGIGLGKGQDNLRSPIFKEQP
jgi:hypothetical protein